MKNSYIVYLLILVTGFSCNNDDENNLTIEGIWFQDSGKLNGSELSYRNEIIFKRDGTYERSLQIVETNDAQDIVGYMSLIIGEYQVNNRTLKRFNIEQYGLDNMNPYLDRNDLVFHDSTDKLPDIGWRLNYLLNELTLEYTCPASGSCIAYETFYRSNL